MGIIRTDKWLTHLYDQPLKMCDRLRSQFSHASSSDIYTHLLQHGMYQIPLKDGRKTIDLLKQQNSWEILQKELKQLQQKWNGPDVPVYIFPSDTTNHSLQKDHNGKSGLAFKDKLFLFFSEENAIEEIKALFTHEYNHVCRLNAFPSPNEEDITLLDAIIMEGLAEHAVYERFGNKFMADWTTYYSEKDLQKIWHRLIYPNRKAPKFIQKHRDILYGFRFYPKMIGYCVGYYLVQKYTTTHNATSKDLLSIPSNEIAGITDD
ncbi:DUF2268 domain-containing protein [Oceanobacillus halotolerans]|uniref:DUF2268 domain-containing protein n=1 Tax=Oceanobacillus halotolerans TaxID=2663380 RepID=UPI0013DC3199|nr:DUF2268 domain-containing protein [Oceanobacillus halotolerans]